MSSEPLATIDDLTISYRAGGQQVVVVEGINATLTPGRTLGLVGESGSGKSTVARTLLGHLRSGSRIDRGRVTALGQNLFELPQRRLRELRGKELALVAQNAGDCLTPSMRVGEQIREVLAVHGLPAGQEQVLELLQRVRLPDPHVLARRYPHQLSGGQQQRVTIAMAVATEPRILVLDEPTTALDVVTQAAVLALVNELRDELGMAVLIVSHDLGVVSAVADEVIVMREGTAVEDGRTTEVLRAPQHDYTRALLAAAPRVEGESPQLAELAKDEVLACTGIDIRYPRAPRRAVTDFSLQIRRAETVALVGESGSGKSTVATALAGLVQIEAGRTALRDADGTAHDLRQEASRRALPVRRSVQMVFQNADLALNPRRTVGDAIARPLAVFKRKPRGAARKQEVTDLLTEVGLGPEFAGRLPAQLSGGQRQRVGIARALAAQPALLIADEITTALDVSVQADVLQLLDDLRSRRGLACLFISHDLAVVRSVAHRILVMKSGYVVESAPAEQLFRAPRHPYTRTLLEAVVEPGHTELPESDADTHDVHIDPDAELVQVGGTHLVRADEGALTD